MTKYDMEALKENYNKLIETYDKYVSKGKKINTPMEMGICHIIAKLKDLNEYMEDKML